MKQPFQASPITPPQIFTFSGPAFADADASPQSAPTSPFITHSEFWVHVLSCPNSRDLWKLFQKAKNGLYPTFDEISDAARSISVPCYDLSVRIDEEFRAPEGETVKAAAATVAAAAYGLTPAEASAALEAVGAKKRKRADEPMHPLRRRLLESGN